MKFEHIPGEEWRDVPEYEGIYQVSHFGRVKRFGGTPRCRYDRIIKPRLSNTGYLTVSLSFNSVVKQKQIHQLVMQTFVGPQPEGVWVNHINGIKTDNRLQNLEYATPSENTQHAYDTGLRSKLYGTDNGKGFIDEETIYLIEIAYRYAFDEFGFSRAVLAQTFGVSRTTLTNIINRKERYSIK